MRCGIQNGDIAHASAENSFDNFCFRRYYYLARAPMAKLDKASDYGSEDCGFEFCWARHRENPLRQPPGALFFPLPIVVGESLEAVSDDAHYATSR